MPSHAWHIIFCGRIALCLLCLLLLRISDGVAQQEADVFSDILESLVQDLELDGDFDFDAIYERLTVFTRHPVDLNRGELRDFVDLGLLTEMHLHALSTHIRAVGPLVSVYELQSVPGFDIDVIRRLRPFVRVGGSIWDARQPLMQMILRGDKELFVRWSHTAEEQRGYTPDAAGNPRYHGSPHRVYTRFRHRSENRLSYGFTAEKDPGEEFLRGSNKQGFDFYSYHFFLNNYRRWMPRLALGDFNVNLGQGLVMNASFGVGKSAFVTQIKRGGYAIRPYASVNESDFLRGAAITLEPLSNISVTAFASHRIKDANVQMDTLEIDGARFEDISFTSLQTSGLHRTASEIANKGQIKHNVFGGSIKYRKAGISIAVNSTYQTLSSPLRRADALYNTYRFQGDRLFNASVDYSYIRGSVHFFGETAMSGNGAVASINGLLVGLHRFADAALLMRLLPRDYHHLGARVFAETSSAENEHGIYLGLEVRPHPEWFISAYADVWRHPWLRFRVDAPSTGHEQMLRITWRKRRNYEVYVQYRHELKERNLTGGTENLHKLVDHRRQNVRLNFAQTVMPGIELRSRIEGSFYREHTHPLETGFMLYQDVIYRPLGSALSFTGRIALFDTDGFNTRIYAYENDLINQFYIPAFSDRGIRYYLNLRYRGIRNITAEFRIAQTRYSNRETIGSGNELIEGNVRTDLKAQIRWVF